MMRALGWVLAVIVAALIFGWAAGAWAQVVDDPQVHAQNHSLWINRGGYKSPADGTHCCGKNDCQIVSSTVMQSTAVGHYITITGETIPYSETQPSENGEYWMCRRHDGSRRCFFAPDLGS